VVDVTLVKQRRSHPSGRLALWAWIAVALAPVGCGVGVVLAFLSGNGQAEGIGPVAVGVLGVVLFVAGPTAAVILAVQAARAGHRSGKAAVVVSGLLLLAALGLAPMLGTIALVLVGAVLGLLGWRYRTKPPPDGNGAHDRGPASAPLSPPGMAGPTR
jgi:hypothetical protein